VIHFRYIGEKAIKIHTIKTIKKYNNLSIHIKPHQLCEILE